MSDPGSIAQSDQYSAAIRDLVVHATHALRQHASSRASFEQGCLAMLELLNEYDDELSAALLRKLVVVHAGTVLELAILGGSSDGVCSCNSCKAIRF
ncbi:hypothetical protein ACWIBQ_03380 [Microbacterium keratanolyticum]